MMGEDGQNMRVSKEVLAAFPQVKEKAVVDIVNNLEVLNDHLRWRDERDDSFLARLWDGLTGASARRQQAIDRSFQGTIAGVNDWLHALQAAQAESDIALTCVAERLLETRQKVKLVQKEHAELRRRLDAHIVDTDKAIRDLHLALASESARTRAKDAIDEVDARWRNYRVEALPPLLRVLMASNHLYWNKFGAFLRLKGTDDGDARYLIDHAQNVLANMAADLVARKNNEPLIVDSLLDSLENSNILMDWRDASVFTLEAARRNEQPLAASARIRLLRSNEKLPDHRPRLIQPSYLGELALRETVRRIESEPPLKNCKVAK